MTVRLLALVYLDRKMADDQCFVGQGVTWDGDRRFDHAVMISAGPDLVDDALAHYCAVVRVFDPRAGEDDA